MPLRNLFKPRLWMLPVAALGLAIGVVVGKQKPEVVTAPPVDSQLPRPPIIESEPIPAVDDLAAGIDGETMAACYRCGGQYGKMNSGRFGFGSFVNLIRATPSDLPAFQFKGVPEGTLPVIGVPFAIYLFGVPQLADADLERLSGQKNLAAIYLDSKVVTDAGLKALENLPGLTKLHVQCPGVTGCGWQKFRAITHLNLSGSGLTDEGLKELSEHKSITHLSIGMTQVTASGLKELKGFQSITFLELSGAPITDAGLRDFQEWKHLQVLGLAKTSVTDEGMKELKHHANLTGLYLWEASVTDAGLKELVGLKKLDTLSLEQTKITDAGLKDLKAFPALKFLNLFGTKITDAGIKELKDLKSLMNLDLSFTAVTDIGLKELQGFKNLATLNLTQTQVTAQAVAELKIAIPNCNVYGITSRQSK